MNGSAESGYDSARGQEEQEDNLQVRIDIKNLSPVLPDQTIVVHTFPLFFVIFPFMKKMFFLRYRKIYRFTSEVQYVPQKGFGAAGCVTRDRQKYIQVQSI